MIKKVIFSFPNWQLGGVSVFTSNLAKQLIKENYEVEILLTQLGTKRYSRKITMSLDKSLTFKKLNVKTKENNYWKSHWESTRKYLEKSAPCIYLPNYDHITAAVSPILSDDILIIGIVHNDSNSHYDSTKRLGRYWNGIVAVSDGIYDNIREFDQYNKDKIFKIDYGVKVADEIPVKNVNNNFPIKLVYTGRLVQKQKRIFDLPKIMQRLSDKKVNFIFSIVGNGSEEDIIRKECKSFINKGICKFYGKLSNDNVFEILRNSDLFILTSEFEGKPLSLLEAMGQGCVPVVSDIQSGIPELIENGENGYIVPMGDIEKFADCIENLYSNRNKLKELSSMAFQTVNNNNYKIETMAKKYIEVFNFTERRKKSGEFIRPKGDILPPKSLWHPDVYQTISWRITAPLRFIGKKFRRVYEF